MSALEIVIPSKQIHINMILVKEREKRLFKQNPTKRNLLFLIHCKKLITI